MSGTAAGRARRRDTSEKDIVRALRAAGATVWRLTGDGAPDLLVLYRQCWLPLEVKSAGGKALPKQVLFPIVRTAEEALRAIGALRHGSGDWRVDCFTPLLPRNYYD